MDHSNNVHLRWNKHQTTLLSVFDALLNSEKLTDCTISAEGRQLRAHKIILSACSPYFEEIFSENYEKHPIIILHDVKYDTVKALMDFMYRGEVEVPQEKLSGVLKLSVSLQIRGLSANGCGDHVNFQKDSRSNAPPLSPLTLQSISVSMPCFISGQNEIEGKMQSFRGRSPVTSAQEENSVRADAIPKSIGKYRKSISHSGSDQRTGLNSFEEVITLDLDSVHQHASQRQVQPTTYSSTGERLFSPIYCQSSCNELKSPSGDVAGPENEQLTPEAVLPDKKSANLSEEVSLEIKSEVLNSEMEIVEDLTLDDDDDDDYYYGDDSYHDANSAEDDTGEGRRVSKAYTHVENFHPQGIDNPNSSFDGDYLRNSVLSAPSTILQNRFNCPICGKSYLYRKGLCRHLKHECGKEPQFQCPRCDKRCARTDQLRAHMLSRRCRMQNSEANLEGNR